MMSREQMYTLLQMRAQGGNIFSALPRDILRYTIVNAGDGRYDPNSDIAKLLHHIAYGAEEDLVEIRRMLAKNPRLVLEAGNVMTRAGILVIRTTPLECALGSGSPEIAAIIHDVFEHITDERGAKVADAIKVREAIYKRYRPHIEKMLDQKPYDFEPLLIAIKASSAKDIKAALKNKLSTESDLYKALAKFRADFTPDNMTVGMHFNYNEHCNYQTLLRAFEVADLEYDNLAEGYPPYINDDFSRNNLFTILIIGFIERSFCSDERFIFARDYFPGAERGAPLERSLVYRYKPEESFPDAVGDSSHSGLGFEYWASGGGAGTCGTVLACRGHLRLKNIFEKKRQSLLNLCSQDLHLSPEKKICL